VCVIFHGAENIKQTAEKDEAGIMEYGQSYFQFLQIIGNKKTIEEHNNRHHANKN